jgi:hypothetical protein
MESFVKENYIFSCCKKATNGSSFYSLEKNNFTNKLAMDSWN